MSGVACDNGAESQPDEEKLCGNDNRLAGTAPAVHNRVGMLSFLSRCLNSLT